jgi:hypothetical protein
MQHSIVQAIKGEQSITEWMPLLLHFTCECSNLENEDRVTGAHISATHLHWRIEKPFVDTQQGHSRK